MHGSSFVRLAVAGEAALALLGLGLGSLVGVAPLRLLNPSFPSILWGVAATVPLLIGLACLLRARTGPFRRLVNLVVEQLGPVLAARSPAELVLLAGLAGLGEELLFRGVVQAGLARVIPVGWALLVASLLFGLAHFATSTYAILAAVIGLYLGTLLLALGNLVVPVVAHSLYDLVALIWIARLHRSYRATTPS